MTTKITEGYRVGSRVELPKGKGLEGEIRLMGWEPGATVVEGSSGDYPIAAIKRDFAEAFPAGTRMRANHDGICESGGDIRRIMAKTTSDPVAREDGMYAKAYIAEQWSEWVKEFGDVIGISITAGVEWAKPEPLPEDQAYNADGEPIDENGEPLPKQRRVLERFLTAMESPYNSVDVVEAPGADGAIVSLALESARSHLPEINMREAATFTMHTLKPAKESSKATPPRNNQQEKNMDPQEIAAAIEQAAAAGAQAAVEALRPSETPQEIRYDDVAEAAFTAGLSRGSREAVYRAVRAGDAVEAAVAREQEREAEIEARVNERLGNQSIEGLTGYTSGSVSTATELPGGAKELSLADFDAMVGV